MATVAKNYAARLKCPQGDADEWLILRDRKETLEQVLNTAWHFECPVHGVQQEIPLEAREIRIALSSQKQPMGTPVRKFKAPRRSKRLPLRVPVLVYGRNRRTGAFHEQTATDLVNAHGGLIALNARVRLGETLLIVNPATQEEQGCRVAYVGLQEGAKKKVGIAFLRSAPHFWGIDFPPSI